MSNRLLRILPLVGITVSGCYSQYLLRPGALKPATATIPVEQRLATWHRAIAVLLDDGYSPQLLNEGACLVSGKRRDDIDYGTLSGSTATVTITPEGLVRVDASGRGLYLSQDALAADIDAMQSHLLRRILDLPEPPVAPKAALPPRNPDRA